MKDWVVIYDNEKISLGEMVNLFFIVYKPRLIEGIVFIASDLPKEEIEKIDGIKEVREPLIGNLFV